MIGYLSGYILILQYIREVVASGECNRLGDFDESYL